MVFFEGYEYLNLSWFFPSNTPLDILPLLIDGNIAQRKEDTPPPPGTFISEYYAAKTFHQPLTRCKTRVVMFLGVGGHVNRRFLTRGKGKIGRLGDAPALSADYVSGQQPYPKESSG